MSVGPTNAASSVAATQLAQNRGTDADRNSAERTNQSAKAAADQKASDAAGIGQTEQDREASDRDADGRRVWELGEAEQRESADDVPAAPRGRDATGQRGNQIDLSG